MIFNSTTEKLINVSLCDFEKTLKKLTADHTKCDPCKPHSFDEIKDLIQAASAKSQNNFTANLIEQQLEENSFFHNNTDVEIYQHLRYLPAYWHSHNFIEIACVIQGTCTNYIQNSSIEMQEGDVCIIAPGTKHAISAFTDDCILFNILLRTSTFETAFFGVLNESDILSDFFIHTLYHSPGHPYLLFRAENDHELFNYIGYAYHESIRNRQYKNRMIISVINAFFIILLRNHGADVILPDSSENNDDNTILVLKYIQEHYNTLSLSELAGFFNYSERQLQRIIKNSTGMSFSENIQRLKLRQAARMLQNPDLSISFIAEELGYTDPSNFRHMFKKYYNMTPTEYRSTL